MSQVEHNIFKLKFDIKNKLGKVTFETDAEERAHITINPDVCRECPHQKCLFACPTRCYNLIDGEIKFQYEDCVECGTCFLVCDQGSVSWSNPQGTFGVKYHHG